MQARSVETNMENFIDKLLNTMDNDLQIGVVYNDFYKAFDKICHNLLLEKS